MRNYTQLNPNEQKEAWGHSYHKIMGGILNGTMRFPYDEEFQAEIDDALARGKASAFVVVSLIQSCGQKVKDMAQRLAESSVYPEGN